MISTNHLFKKQKIFLSSKKNKGKLLLLRNNNQLSESYMMISGNKSVNRMLSESLNPVFFMSATGPKSSKMKLLKNSIKRSSHPMNKFFKSQVSKDFMCSKKVKLRSMLTGHQDIKNTSKRF